jgi:hypothetical protein
MGTQTNNRSKLLAAVSALSLSVGMVPAIAADQTDQATSQQHKTSTQLKFDSMQHKSSNQLKYESNQLKLDSMQHKSSNQLKLDSMQHKSSNQLKQNGSSHNLNPQPLPPG